MAVNQNSDIYKSFSSGTEGPSAIPMPKPKETGSEEDDDLRKKTQSAQSVEEARRAKLEKLVEAIKERSVFFSGDSSETKEQEKTKLSIVEDFCRQSKEFNVVVEFLENTARSLKLPEMAKSFAEKLDSILQNPFENPYNIIRVRGFNPNEIKLNEKNGKENLVDQLEAKEVDLKSVEDNIKKCARYLDKDRPHFVLMVLPDGRFLTLDINQYERDKEQNLNAGPPLGPQESIQKQPALGPIKGILKKTQAPNYSPEPPTENQTEGINYLPPRLPGFETTFQAGNKHPVAEGPPLGLQESNQKQNVAEGPPSGPRKTPEQPVAEGPQKINKPNTHQEKKVTWAEKMEQVRFIPGRESPGR
jgi:hypothetical protein